MDIIINSPTPQNMIQIKPRLVAILVIFLLIFKPWTSYSQQSGKDHVQDFDGFSNEQYASYLAKDGWPVETLNTARNAAYLSDVEKNLVLAMNLIRHDPVKYAKQYVHPRIQYYKGNMYNAPGRIPMRTQEGVGPVKELYRELLKAKPLPLFYPSEGISKGSRDHAHYMKENGKTTHDGQGGMSARVSRYGEWVGGLSENLQWGTSNAHEAIMSLMIDDGVKNRGHRINMMNPGYKKVGVAVADHPKWRVSYVINYANDFIEKSSSR
jgi:hypothetical protein